VWLTSGKGVAICSRFSVPYPCKTKDQSPERGGRGCKEDLLGRKTWQFFPGARRVGVGGPQQIRGITWRWATEEVCKRGLDLERRAPPSVRSWVSCFEEGYVSQRNFLKSLTEKRGGGGKRLENCRSGENDRAEERVVSLERRVQESKFHQEGCIGKGSEEGRRTPRPPPSGCESWPQSAARETFLGEPLC